MTPFVIWGVFVKGFIGNVLKGVIKSFFIMPYNFSTWHMLAKVWENSLLNLLINHSLIFLFTYQSCRCFHTYLPVCMMHADCNLSLSSESKAGGSCSPTQWFSHTGNCHQFPIKEKRFIYNARANYLLTGHWPMQIIETIDSGDLY